MLVRSPALMVVALMVVPRVKSQRGSDGVRFPGSATNSRSSFSALKIQQIQPCPSGVSFCTNVQDYPRGVELVQGLKEKKLLADKIFDNTVGSVNLKTPFDGEKRACRVRKGTVFPQKARNVKGNFVFIVNDNRYKQSVEIEQCDEEGGSCRIGSDAPSFGSTICKQKYSTHKMYAINENMEQVYDSFSLPSACICHHKKERSRFDPRTRASDLPRKNHLPFCAAGEKLDIPDEKQRTQQETERGQSFDRSQAGQSRGQFFSGFQTGNRRGKRDTWWQSNQREVQKSPRRRRQQTDRTLFFRRRNSRDDRRGQGGATNGQEGGGLVRGQQSGRLRQPGACPTGASFCASVPDYPTGFVRGQLDRQGAQSGGVNSELFKQVFNGLCTATISTRGFSIDEEQLCFGSQNVVFPRQARNSANQWRFVVNIDNYTQSVEVEECAGPSSFSGSGGQMGDCLYSGSTGNNPEVTFCKQVYTEHKLLALSDQGQLEVDSFMLPSACACFLSQDDIGEFFL